MLQGNAENNSTLIAGCGLEAIKQVRILPKSSDKASITLTPIPDRHHKETIYQYPL